MLEEKFLQAVETQPELVAHHYTEAGLIAQAIPYWKRAGQRAVARSAHVEAIAHLAKGLELLKALPDTPERARQELLLQTALSPALMAIKGWAAPEVGKAYARARELCQQVGATPQLFPVLYGLCGFYTNRAELSTARELGEQFLTLTQSVQDPALLMEAHYALGQVLFRLGEFALAQEHVEQGVALYNPQQHRSHAFLYGQDSGMACLLYAALALWHLGYPDQALKRIHDALTLTQELSHSYSRVGVPVITAMLHQFRQEGQIAQEQAEAAIALSNEQGFPLLLARGTILRGWALAEQGQEEGIVQVRQGLAALQTTGAELDRPYYLALLAEVYGKAEQAEEGFTVLTEALDLVHKTGGRFYEAELYRLKGQLTLQQFNVQGSKFKVEEEAEAYFLKAIKIAQRQQAKSLELRATTSLARLWQQQGRQKEAHRMLAEIYGWFTEGFDTADLKEAKALLEELA